MKKTENDGERDNDEKAEEHEEDEEGKTLI